jgi:hypothetical protein
VGSYGELIPWAHKKFFSHAKLTLIAWLSGALTLIAQISLLA